MSSSIETTNTLPVQVDDWRKNVYLPDTYSQECQDFLDNHVSKGVLSRRGNFQLKDNIGEVVPYELCPGRVKLMLQKITAEGDLPRSAFKSTRDYRCAVINLHIYGYLQNLKDHTLMQKRRVTAQYTKRWSRNNSDKVKQYSANAHKYKRKWKNECELLNILSQ
jgi:hypothetical protein